MPEPDIRWKQRFSNYQKALAQLAEAMELHQQQSLSNIERQGLVKAFEFTHELAWNVMKIILSIRATAGWLALETPPEKPFKIKWLTMVRSWMDMIKTRNKAVHTYDETMIEDVILKTSEVYYPLFVEFEEVMQGLMHDE